MRPSFHYTRYNAFGWILHRKTLEKGETFNVEVPASYSPSNGYNISLWTKGLVVGTDVLTGLPTQTKVPGISVIDRAEVPLSNNKFIAEEPSEFWCINYTINRRRLPEVEIVRIPAQTIVLIEQNSKVLFCIGVFKILENTYTGPISLEFTSQAHSILALEDTYGFIFKKEA